jgi:membrane protein YqaA with SNARE-associated domain
VEAAGLAGLFASSFLSATLLPGNSEIVFVALLHHAPELEPRARCCDARQHAGRDDVLPVGRLFPRPQQSRALAWLTRYGPAALLLSWVPVIGDALCVASGWLRQNAIAATLFIAAGKFARYWALAAGLSWWRS